MKSRIGDNAAALVAMAALGAFLLAPLAALALQAVTSDDGRIGLAGAVRYLTSPGLAHSLANTLELAVAVVATVIPLALLTAFALERTALPFKGFLTAATGVPLLIPSLLPALALVYLFGRQGLLTPLFGGQTIYGAQGVYLADVIATFPHALVIIRTALSAADGRLYEQAALLGAKSWRAFLTITLPGVRHGLVAAATATFSLTIADIGAPKVVGGNFDVLALDIFKAVVGRQDFTVAAAASLFLLTPSLFAVAAERMAARKRAALISSRSTPFTPTPNRVRDVAVGVGAWTIALAILGVLGVCQMAALVARWPYDLSLSLAQYDLDRVDGGGWSALSNSVLLGLTTATLGTAFAFFAAWASERSKATPALRQALSAIALAPAAVPGLALGVAYVLVFNDPANPLHVLYGGFGILIAVSVTHAFTVAYLTCAAALKSLDAEFEAAGDVLGGGGARLVARVIAPLCAPALVEVFVYLFVAATTTVSAVVFLYPPDVKLASVAILNMDDAGDIAPAAAMGMLIVYVNLCARGLGLFAQTLLKHRRTSSADAAVSGDSARAH